MAAQGTKVPEDRKPNVLRRAWTVYEDGLGRLVGYVARKFGDLGAFSARRPILVLLVSLLAGVLICAGWGRFHQETESDVLWVPQTGKAREDTDYVKSEYPRSQAGASFYAQLAPAQVAPLGGNNAVQLPVTWEIFQLHNKVMALRVMASDDAELGYQGGQQVGFMDLCYRNLSGGCDISSGYLWYWYKDFQYYVNAVQSTDATNPRAGNETAFREQATAAVYPDGGSVSLLSVFGGTTFQFNPIRIQSAQVIANDYTLDDRVDKKTAKRWHDAFTDLMEAELPKQQYMTYTWITGSTVGEELGKSINNDMFLVVISIIIFIIIAILFLSKPNAVTTRTTLALAGVFVTALGICSGWGWGMIFGMPFTPLQQLSPFILLGMGVDVVFILVKSYEIIVQRQPWLTLEESFSKLMSTAGLSVQVTLLASAVAFALGSVDRLNSVKWFSAFATLNALMIMVLMMTLFIAFMVLTERRIKARRIDCCCCIRRGRAETAPAPPSQPSFVLKPAQQQGPMTPHAVVNVQAITLSDDDIKDENAIKRFFRKYYGPALAKWYVKVPIICIFLAYAVIAWYGIYQVEYGQPLSELAPDGSYLQDYDNVQEATYRQEVGAPVGLYFRNIDVSDPAVQYKMLKSWDLALQNEFINSSTSSTQSNWMISFIHFAQLQNKTVVLPEYNCYNPITDKVTGNLAGIQTPSRTPINGCVAKADFYTLFQQWLKGSRNNNIVCECTTPSGSKDKCSCSTPDATIRTSKFNMLLIPSAGDDKYSAHLVDSVRSLEKDINRNVLSAEKDQAGGDVAFVWNGQFINYEGDAILPEQALIYFMLALVGVGVVTTFMLVNPVASLLMMVSVGLVVLYLFGELWILKVKFNQVSIINMIMATGLAVDYSVYFAQKFMTVSADGTGNGRMQKALTDTGSAVFLGGFTALCGTVPMAFSKSVIIRTFFKLIFGTILFALLIGLVLMPVLFSLIPIPPVKSVLMEGEAAGPPVPSKAQSDLQDTSSSVGAEKV